MSTLRYRDSDKSINNSAEDYLTLSNYYDSFYNIPKISQLRMVIAPGTVKYFNRAFSYDKVNDTQNVINEVALTPLPLRSKNYDDQYDYASYPKIS